MSTKPALRPLDFQPVIYEGQQLWFLRDPLQLSDQQLLLPPALAHMLHLIDGTRTAHEIHADFCREVGQMVDFEVVTSTLAELDRACLLENERARHAMQEELAAFHALPHRPPTLAGLNYPQDRRRLVSYFEQFARNGQQSDERDVWQGRAIVSPHIDYQRGGPVYGQVWGRAADAVAEADLVLIFGTDHNGGLGTVTLTRQAYATPFGALPSAGGLIQALDDAVGGDRLFELELNHRQEHSIELSAAWLHYVYHTLGEQPAPMLPVLCGSFQHFLTNGQHPAEDEMLTAFLQALQAETAGLRVLAVASVDLAHVGPSFGDPFPVDEARRQDLAQSDRRLMEAIRQGDHARFYDEIAGVEDRNRICGFSSLYLMLRYLDGAEGVEVAYEHCPADDEGNSFVSICGLLLD
ncbi:MAG TPA: AmmeMemoRadiSam system protein B [Candidatus Sulfomarinibacteraceae bacterium]|nr:AmmeMemoRadiSam system protein B [Candidatus Sulfomarinibacteraceae bacterium]